MKLNWWPISFFIAAIVLGMLLMKSCNNNARTQSRYEDSIRKRDAAIQTIAKKEQQVKQERDSIFCKSLVDSVNFRHSNDSLKAIISALRGNLSVAKDSTIRLWAQLKTFYLNGDTASLRRAYYALRDELDSTNNIMVAIQFQHERIEYNLRNEADSAHATIRTLYTQLDVLKALLDKQTQIAENQNKEEARILEKQKRRKMWGLLKDIGIGIGALFLGKKL